MAKTLRKLLQLTSDANPNQSEVFLMTTPCLTLGQIVAEAVNVGLEVEKMRVTPQSLLSAAPFPDDLEPALSHFVTREFFTAQLEFTLPATPKVAQNIRHGTAIIQAVAEQLPAEDCLWPYSCPPLLPQVSPALISPYPEHSYPYRQQLSRLYPLPRLMNTGVHINFSFQPAALSFILAETAFVDADALYVHLAQYFMLHHWVFTYLFGATPAALTGYFTEETPPLPVRSLRNSRFGFPRNIAGDYASVPRYVARIQVAIEAGQLMKAGQYYEPVRLKSGANKNPEHLLEAGISHLELRGFDLNPFTPLGVTADQLRLVQSLALYFAYQPRLNAETLAANLAAARQLNDRVALEDPHAPSECQKAGVALLTSLAAFAAQHDFPAAYQSSIQAALKAFEDSTQTLAYQIWQQAPVFATR
ncbi:hypothetical protein [Lacticaseibacillus suibinensis]|uniref:hypothetical protein n=1 Tax=Lacticaseibacillus suibinensis TaxID=2486011 RepID=UPI000F76A1FF|nr:hypothetical protein [Lacticaseibacillus suibinensis]